MAKTVVAFGLLGTQLDRGKGPERWERWRPTVALHQHEDLIIGRFELIHTESDRSLAASIAEDIRSVSPETEVVSKTIAWTNPWDFEEVYGALHDFARDTRFRPET